MLAFAMLGGLEERKPHGQSLLSPVSMLTLITKSSRMHSLSMAHPHLGFFSFSCRNAGRRFSDLCGQSLTHTHVLWPACLLDALHPDTVFPSSFICNHSVLHGVHRRGILDGLPYHPTSILIGRQFLLENLTNFSVLFYYINRNDYMPLLTV